MSLKLSTTNVAEILRRRAGGQSSSEIGSSLGIPESSVANILDQIQEELLPNKRPSSRKHKLTANDKSKGGHASQRVRNQQRGNYADRILGLINTRIKSIELATAFYWLQAGSSKEFSITLPNAEVGLLFEKALRTLGVPDDSMMLNWRCRTSDKEQEEIQNQWGELASTIRFPDNGSSKSMRLRISPFQASDLDGIFKISSRGLAKAFLKAGQQVVVNAAGQ